MTPRWRTLADLRAFLKQVREWEAKHDDVAVTCLIHGRSDVRASLVERARQMRGAR